MASAYVPPPPEEDFLGFSTEQEDTLSQTDEFFTKPSSQSSHFGGDGFIGSTYPVHHFSPNLLPSQKGRYSKLVSSTRLPGGHNEMQLQQVPETPAPGLARRQFSRTPMTSDCRLDFSFDAPNEPGGRGRIGLRSVSEIPEMYRSVFKNFSHFNLVQSKVFDDVLYTNSPLVTSAPTGSGKTVIFELAIIRLLMQLGGQMASAKIIYVAPIKALCTERFEDWQAKFGPLGLKCCELTGDSQLDDYFELQNAQIVMTTPEKWDSMTRKWRDHKSLVQLVKLFLIDEVHQLNDETRGPTMEAIVSRMKTIRSSLLWDDVGRDKDSLRFIAVSATMPNISDVAAWLGSSEGAPALEYAIDESHRPVRLRKVVLGYPDASTEFKFDLSLNYRLSGVIQCYSDQKPTLVFCATRKGTQQAANTLVKDARFVMNSQHKQRLVCAANSLKDGKLRDLVVYGVGYHHAGMDVSDRKAVESLFTAGELPVLFATSTLAMGVNLPAHLVVIKSTMHYITGMFQECSESQLLQMIGRAGRPQFDTTATAVIMTRNSTKMKYEALLSGTQLIESSLHHHLIEHLNAEIVLNTVTDVSMALEWLRSTFFHIRVRQNPQHYGLPEQHEQKEEKLQQLCLKHLHMLEEAGLVNMEDGFTLQPTDTGRLMARYYVAFDSMKRFLGFNGKEDLGILVSELSKCKEFEDVRLRMNERKVLNTLNKDKNRQSIRFPMTGKIKTTDMKVNCLIQANLGCLPVQEFGLNQDTQKILRAASRLSRCLMELELLSNNFECLLSAVLLHKCLQAKLWENSKYVSRQLDKIGLTLSTALVNAGLTSFDKIQQKTPRELELILNRHPPFGNQVHEAVSRIPRYSLSVEQSPSVLASHCELTIVIGLTNFALFKERGASSGSCDHSFMLLVGDQDNRVLCRQRLNDSQLMGSGQFTRKLSVQRCSSGDDLRIHIISLDMVGLDLQEVYTPRYSLPRVSSPRQKSAGRTTGPGQGGGGVGREVSGGEYRKACNHRCVNKAVCGHECCKTGIIVKAKQANTGTFKQPQRVTKPQPSTTVGAHTSLIHARTSAMPRTPRIRCLTPVCPSNDTQLSKSSSLSSRYGYTPKPGLTSTHRGPAVHQSSLDSATSYTGGSSTHGRSAYGQDGADLDSSDFDNDLWLPDSSIDCDDGLQPSKSMDLSDWFDPDIAYFTSNLLTECTPKGNSTHSKKGAAVSKRVAGQSAVSKISALSQRLRQEQPAAHQAAVVCEPLPVRSGLNGRKRLIDELFDELLEPTTQPLTTISTPEKRTMSVADTMLTVAVAQTPTPSPQSAKKAKVEFDSSKTQEMADRDMREEVKCAEETLSKKLSSQAQGRHSHTEACAHSLSCEAGEVAKAESIVSSFYDTEPATLGQDKPTTTTSFFTAGPVSNEEEEGDLFGSVFAGIF